MAEAFTLEALVIDAYQYSIGELGALVEILGSGSFLDAMSDEELVDHWASAWVLQPVEWDISRPEEIDLDEVVTLSGQRLPTTSAPIRRLYLPIVPKKSNAKVLTLRPEKGWTERGPSLRSTAAYIQREEVIMLRGTKEDLINLRATAVGIMELINDDIDRYYRGLRPAILHMVQQRRGQLAAEHEEFRREARELGVRIRQRSDAPRLVDIRERAEVQVLREPASRQALPSNPCLSPDSIRKIVDLIDRAGEGFGVAPQEFRKLGEEGLRHVIVSYLNAVFHSTDVSGETFSKDGRPDLVIMRDGRPVMVGECKFWDGAALYSETLGKQLVRYILWQHTVAVLVTFAERHNLTRVVREARRATEEHPSTVGIIQEKSKTYFVSTLIHPDDPEKTVEVHHLLFNLHTGSSGRNP